MSLSIGIVGLPNVGKSSLFTALTKKGGLAANYPFATIEPNVGMVAVPDARLAKLAEMDHPARVIPAMVEFVDIAGLVEGASQGEGLGNKFLANIRDTNAICQVLRFFSDPNVEHVSKKVDPQHDADTINMELILADMGTIERALPRLEKEARRGKEFALRYETAKKVYAGFEEEKRAIQLDLTPEEQLAIRELCLLTMKPMLYVANVDEDKLGEDPGLIDGQQPVVISARIESELAEMDAEDAAVFMEELGIAEGGLERLIRAAYRLLGLQSFFTTGPDETRAWTIPVGAKAPQAAGVIHTDFERGFIKAETCAYEDYVTLGGEAGCRAAGKLRQEGKDYVVADGDILHFKFNV